MEMLTKDSQVLDLMLHGRSFYEPDRGKEISEEAITQCFKDAGIGEEAAKKFLARYASTVVDANIEEPLESDCSSCGAPSPERVEEMVATAFFHGFLTRTAVESGYEPTEHDGD
jgi:hypothetical protein